mgnify:CR=1 FL=1
MATNKHAQIRYLTLDRCFSNYGRNYSYDDLLEECNKAIYEYTGIKESIKLRQLQYDINYMESDAGYTIELEKYRIERKVHFRYKDPNFSINNSPLSEEEANKLKEALFTLNRIKGLPQFDWVDEMILKLQDTFNASKENKNIIGFDNMPFLKGIDFISELYNKILYKNPIHLKYQPFHMDQPMGITIHPYFLKQYNNRWFLIGLNNDDKRINNIALDRIKSFVDSKIEYVNTEIDFEEHFEDIVGVSVTDMECQLVKLKITKPLWPYIKTKPIHGSQKIIEKNDDYTIIKLEVKLNYELKSQILQYGNGVQVIEPKELKEDIFTTICQMKENYNLACK